MGDREFIGEAWMSYLKRHKMPFILRLRENQHVLHAGYEARTIADVAKRLEQGQKMTIKGQCHLGQDASDTSPAGSWL